MAALRVLQGGCPGRRGRCSSRAAAPALLAAVLFVSALKAGARADVLTAGHGFLWANAAVTGLAWWCYRRWQRRASPVPVPPGARAAQETAWRRSSRQFLIIHVATHMTSAGSLLVAGFMLPDVEVGPPAGGRAAGRLDQPDQPGGQSDRGAALRGGVSPRAPRRAGGSGAPRLPALRIGRAASRGPRLRLRAAVAVARPVGRRRGRAVPPRHAAGADRPRPRPAPSSTC